VQGSSNQDRNETRIKLENGGAGILSARMGDNFFGAAESLLLELAVPSKDVEWICSGFSRPHGQTAPRIPIEPA
jgi:hypothetical protein